MLKLFAAAFLIFSIVACDEAAEAAVLNVGPNSQYRTITAAIQAAHADDIILVQAGVYTNDFPPTITVPLTLEAMGGQAVMSATKSVPNGKAILVTGANITVNNFTFTGTRVPDANGAGIRYQGGNLTLNSCYFYGNQEGLLGGNDLSGTITINNTEFYNNGVANPHSPGYGLTHNLYVGQVAQLIINNSYFHHVNIGHEIKSRASSTTITNSRIQNESTGTGSYLVDLPNGGAGLIQNSTLEKGPDAQNHAMISFGEEGSMLPQSSLVVKSNTMLNDFGPSAIGVVNDTGITVSVVGNQLWNLPPSQVATGPNTQSANINLSSEPGLDTSHPW